jgi:predicted enzyme related to lactoylglutathione lyase
MTVSSVQVVSIPVTDQDRSRAFYEDALGFALMADSPMGPGMRWVQIGVPGTDVSFTLVTWFESMPPGSQKGLVIGVLDIDEMARRLHAAGYIKDDKVDEQPWGRFVLLDDPDGNSLVLTGAATPSSGAPPRMNPRSSCTPRPIFP